MKFASRSHLFGETIVRTHFPNECADIERLIVETEVPPRPARPFSSGGGKENVPKRQKKGRQEGRDTYALYPADLPKLNKTFDERLRSRGWKPQPYASDEVFATTKDRSKGDFVKNKIFVEVEFGNTASLFRDLFKFQVANRERTGEAAVLVVATRRLARFHDSGVANFEKVERLLDYMALSIQMPVWILGIEPESMDALRTTYAEMVDEASSHGVVCRTWAQALGRDAEDETFEP